MASGDPTCSSRSETRPREAVTHPTRITDSLSGGEEEKVTGVAASSPGRTVSAVDGEKRERQVSAGHVRSAIVAPSHHPPVATATVAMKPGAARTQRSVTDPSAQPGAQALAVLASVSTYTNYYVPFTTLYLNYIIQCT